MADLVLDLAGQGELSLQGRRAQDPLALGQHAHQLGVGVHLDELEDGGPVFVGHPVVRLDLAAGADVGIEGLRVTRLVRRAPVQRLDRIGFVHGSQRVLQDRCWIRSLTRWRAVHA